VFSVFLNCHIFLLLVWGWLRRELPCGWSKAGFLKLAMQLAMQLAVQLAAQLAVQTPCSLLARSLGSLLSPFYNIREYLLR
jgi:hypothetical protein